MFQFEKLSILNFTQKTWKYYLYRPSVGSGQVLPISSASDYLPQVSAPFPVGVFFSTVSVCIYSEDSFKTLINLWQKRFVKRLINIFLWSKNFKVLSWLSKNMYLSSLEGVTCFIFALKCLKQLQTPPEKLISFDFYICNADVDN